eukprot:g23915.t1
MVSQENPLFPHTEEFFHAMDRQLPLILRKPKKFEKSVFVAPLGCENLLLRYIQDPMEWSKSSCAFQCL